MQYNAMNAMQCNGNAIQITNDNVKVVKVQCRVVFDYLIDVNDVNVEWHFVI